MGKYKFGKQTETITLQEFGAKLRSSKLPLKYKSFVAFLYWSGCRLTEALERVKEDFKVEGDILVISIPAKKHGMRMYQEFDLNWDYVKEFILPQIEKTRKKKRVWDFTPRTGQRLVKKVLGKQYYPHYFRLNAAVEFCRNPKTSIQDLKAWFGWKRIESINEYMGLARRDIAEARKKRSKEFAQTEQAKASQ